MTDCRGLSAFGFNDAVNGDVVAKGPHAERFLADRPACVVLPERRLRGSVVLTGAAAARSRVQTGFHWPVESRLPESAGRLRRLPVGLLWERLVASKGRMSEFGGRPVEELLKAHVDAVCPAAEGRRRVVAIPNLLAVAGQERLLRAFGADRRSVTLLWRPVAATLAWLEEIPRERFREPGWAGACWMGPDGIEFTPLRLDMDDPRFVVPARSRPRRSADGTRLDGFDLAVSLARREMTGDARLWQALLRMPDFWLGLAGRQAPAEDTVWSDGGSWAVWPGTLDAPDPDDLPAAFGSVPGTPAAPARLPFAAEIIGGRTGEADAQAQAGSWGERLEEAARRAFASVRGERCLGLVVCGPLAPRGEAPKWLRRLADGLGLVLSERPAPGAVFVERTEDLVSRGARIYGERLEINATLPEVERLPTYLDTFPQIQLCVAAEASLEWRDLFRSDRCVGGRTAESELSIFSLRPGSATVEIWIRINDEDVEEGEIDAENLETTPYFFSEVAFERTHPEEIPLTLKARMQPSSGFASIFFEPADGKFNDILRTGGVSLGIDAMTPKRASELPKLQLAYPPDGHRRLFEAEDWNGAFIGYRNFKNAFVRSMRAGDAKKITNYVKTKIRKEPGRFVYFIDETGRQSTFDATTWKSFLRQVDAGCEQENREWLNVASWLWQGCPKASRDAIFESLRDGRWKIYRIGYAGRVAKTQKQISEVLSEAVTYLEGDKTDGRFSPNLARALTGMFDFNPIGVEVLAIEPEKGNLKYLIDNLGIAFDRLRGRPTIKFSTYEYQWLPSLFATILKVRKWQKDFLRTPEEVRLWTERLEGIKISLDGYAELRKEKGKPMAAQSIRALHANIDAIIDFVRGCGNNVPVLSEDVDD